MSLEEYRARRARLGFHDNPKRLVSVPPLPSAPIPEPTSPEGVAALIDADLKQIRDLLNENQYVPIDAIKKKVCEAFGLNRGDLESEGRSRDLSVPRHISIYLCRKYSGRSFPVISREHGNREHTTALHSYRRVAAWLRGEGKL